MQKFLSINRQGSITSLYQGKQLSDAKAVTVWLLKDNFVDAYRYFIFFLLSLSLDKLTNRYLIYSSWTEIYTNETFVQVTPVDIQLQYTVGSLDCREG